MAADELVIEKPARAANHSTDDELDNHDWFQSVNNKTLEE